MVRMAVGIVVGACALAGCSGSGASLPDDPQPGPLFDAGTQAPREDAGDHPGAGDDAGSSPDASHACVPTTCARAGAECGSIDDGCGHQLNCGGDNNCASPKRCGEVTANKCGCNPLPRPAGCGTGAEGARCDRFADGCGGVYDCGACTQGSLCQIDYPGTPFGTCHVLAWDSGTCKSMATYTGGSQYVFVAISNKYRQADGSTASYGNPQNGPNYYCSEGTVVPPAQCNLHGGDTLNPWQICDASPGY